VLDDFSAIWHEAPATWIRDAVWGDVPLYRQELTLIDSPVFQRLRRVKQLGPLSWVFPGANHTRFEHALGALQLSRLLLLQLRRQPGFPEADAADFRTLLASAVLHDIGHYPFSHALEEVERPAPLPDHADAGADLVRGPLSDVLRKHWKVDPERVAALVSGTGPGGGHPIGPVDQLWQAIVSGPVDVDRLDFLSRDAMFTNVPYGIIDVQRILASLRVWRVDGRVRLLIDEKGIGPLQSFVFGRFLMYGNVYWHHTSRILTRMIVRAVEDAMLAGHIHTDELVELDDSSLVDRLRTSRRGSTARKMVARIEKRDLYKRSVEFRPSDPEFKLLLDIDAIPGGKLAAEAALTRWASNALHQHLTEDLIWLDLPSARSFRPIDGVICKIPPIGYENPVPWEVVSGLTGEDLGRVARSVQRARIVASSGGLAGRLGTAFAADRGGAARALEEVKLTTAGVNVA
jgi:HD superfamily phosphohydrolase